MLLNSEVLKFGQTSSPILKGDEEIKNIRKRADGRWEWRKQINYVRHNLIASTQKQLLLNIKKYKKQINNKKIKSRNFIDLSIEWLNLFKNNIASRSTYESVIRNHFKDLNKNIDKISFEDLQSLLNKLSSKHRIAAYCHSIITNVYKYSMQKDLIKKDISIFLIKPKNKGEKGAPLTIAEQKLVFENLRETPIANEIVFYLLTGCRRQEAMRSCNDNNINFKSLSIFIDGTKTKNAKRFVKISSEYAKFLKINYKNMFKKSADYYTKQFSIFMKKLKIDKKLHDLRHTFSTNLYYLGVPDKKRQYLLGHASIVMTNDVYTTLDPNTTKNDIIKLYNNLYPEF